MGNTIIKKSFDRFIFNRVGFGATCVPGRSYNSFIYNNPFPGTSIDAIIVVRTPNDNWITGYAEMQSSNTFNVSYQNNYSGNVQGNWHFIFVHKYD